MNTSKLYGSAQRICIVSETFAPEVNGVAHTLSQLCQGLKRRGIELHVIRPSTLKQTEQSSQLPTTCVKGLPIPGYPELKFGLPQFAKVKKAMRQFDPDMVYIATEGPLGICALIAAKQLQISVLSGFHTNFHEYTAHYGVSLIKNMTAAYLRIFHNFTHATFVPTDQLKQQLDSLGFNNLKVMSRGIDSGHFSPDKRSNSLRASWGVTDSQPVLLYVGRMAAEKNMGLVIKSWRQLRLTHPDIKLVMVGDGPLKAELEAQNPEAIFLGVKRGEELAQIYASADVFVFASLSETFGNVVTEAMSSGLAVLGFDYAALKQLGVHRFSAMLAQRSSESDFISCLEELITEKGLIPQLKNNARSVCTNRSWQSIADQFYFDAIKVHAKNKAQGQHYGV